MRWLLLKDLQILRRSPLLVALLVAYPVIISVLIGLALSRGPGQAEGRDRQRAARRADELLGRQPAPGRRAVRQASCSSPSSRCTRQHARARRSTRCARARCSARSSSRADATQKLQDAINLAGTAPPTVEVLYNADDPIKAQLVESTIKARLADANKALSDKLTRAGGAVPGDPAQGRRRSRCWARSSTSSACERSKASLERTLRTLPPELRAGAQRQAGRRLRADRHREPRPLRQGAGGGRPAAGGQAHGDRGPSHAAGRLRRGGRR